MHAALGRARSLLATAKNVAVLTGAGISAESGIPTFRDAQTGLWEKFDPMQLASEEGYRADPALVWRWYAWRRELVSKAQPNAGHLMLARAAPGFAAFDVITQNVDGLHARAGSKSLIELHGNIMRTQCLERCGFVEDEPARLPAGEPPRCPRCGHWLRPGVVWFGEMLDPAALDASERAVGGCDVVLVVGTSGLVYPAAGLPATARRVGARVIIVNPYPSEIDGQADCVLRGPAAEVLPALLSS